jgi:hypothetical protein
MAPIPGIFGIEEFDIFCLLSLVLASVADKLHKQYAAHGARRENSDEIKHCIESCPFVHDASEAFTLTACYPTTSNIPRQQALARRWHGAGSRFCYYQYHYILLL